MDRKSNETAESNPYEKPDVNQQRQVTFDRLPDEPPPPYNANIQSSSSDLKVPYTTPAQNTSLNNPATATLNHRFGRRSTEIECPNCHTTIQTRAETSSTLITCLIAIILALFCLCLGLIPFCMSSCKKTVHYCPNCNYMLAKVNEFE